MPMRLSKDGFSLVELSIVLVILGLLVGGALAGKALIESAAMRSQITQFRQYQQAAHAFRDKYFALPGDLPLATAQQLGYFTTGYNGSVGRRDGNGIVQTGGSEYYSIDHEYQLFWMDLSQSGLISGTFPGNGATPTSGGATPNLNLIPGPTHVGSFLPTAAISNQGFVYVTYANLSRINVVNNANNVTGGVNYLTVSAVLNSISGACINSNPALKVVQAWNMDTKIDDGLPATGTAIAQHVNCSANFATGSSSSDSSTSCWNHTTNSYSMNQNNGDGINCGFSVKLL